jgi:DNA polymerase (family 10)
VPVNKRDIPAIFTRIADLLDSEGANPFRIRAYRNAARRAGGRSQSLAARGSREEDLQFSLNPRAGPFLPKKNPLQTPQE